MRQRGGRGAPLPYPLREPQDSLAQSQTVKESAVMENRAFPNPTRAGPCLFGRSVSNSQYARYAASVEGQPTATEGPGRTSEGGITFRPGENAKLRSVLKRGVCCADSSDGDAYGALQWGWPSGCNQVFGGFAFAKWLMNLTGESPTSSRDRPPHRKAAGEIPRVGRSIRQCRNDRTTRRSKGDLPDRRCLGDGSNPPVACGWETARAAGSPRRERENR